MRTVHWADRSVYRITEISFRQHGAYESFDIAEAYGLDARGHKVRLDIHNGPIKAPHGLVFWLFERAEADNIDEHVLLEDLNMYIEINIPGQQTTKYRIAG